MVYLASCNHDEEGRLGWEGKSKAGDQTGSEVSIVPYSTWNPIVWKAVYRAEDPEVAYNIGQAGIQMARNNHIGYDQSQRLTFWEQLSKTGNIDKITTDCETDCSAGTCACIRVAGYGNFPNDLRTAYWDDRIMKYGKFIKFTDDQYLKKDKYLKTGDILLKEGHVVIVVSDGDEAQKYSDIPLYVLRVTGLTPVFTQPKKGGILLSHPALGKDNLVDYCDEDGDYYYVRIVSKWGWIPKDKAERNSPSAPKIGDKIRFKGKGLYTSSGGGGFVSTPEFDGQLVQYADGRPFPCYVQSRAYDGWCLLKEIEKR